MTTVKISALRGTGGSSDISVVGPTTVLSGTSNTYTITDYDDFSVYEVSVNSGSVSRTDEVITLEAPTGSGEPVVILSITRNASTRVFQIGLDGAGVATPSIISPANGNTNIPTSVTLQGSVFSTVPVGAGTHISSEWQVARDSGFTDIVDSATVTTGNLTQYTTTSLPRNTLMYARVRYQSSIGDSGWSSTISFTTTNQQINKPSVSIVGGDFNVVETPTFNSSAFSVTPIGSDTHVASTWIIRQSDDESVVWQLVGSSSNRLTVTIPSGVLSEDTSYTAEVQHIGGFGSSVFSDKLTFTTAQSFFPTPGVPGVPFGGGYYAGANIWANGVEYALVVAPKTLGGESSSSSWGYDGSIAGATSLSDGKANTDKLVSSQAANFCRGLTIGGYNDWYLPSIDELEICFRYLKPVLYNNQRIGLNGNSPHGYTGLNPNSNPPGAAYTSTNPTQTSVDLFKTGGSEAIDSNIVYWSSSEINSGAARVQYFGSTNALSDQNGATKGGLPWPCRAVRRVQITPPHLVPGAFWQGGYVAGLINQDDGVYAIIVAPKSLGGESPSALAWKTTQTATSGTSSVRDGWANTLSMMAAGAAAHPAANFCRNLTIGGYSDWYLPAKDELEILYRYLKPTTQANSTVGYGANTSSVPPQGNYTSGDPTQTSVALFKEGGAEAITNACWASTESSWANSWNQHFTSGIQGTNPKNTWAYARAVRRVKIG